jgi:hypothetical protein
MKFFRPPEKPLSQKMQQDHSSSISPLSFFIKPAGIEHRKLSFSHSINCNPFDIN